ncbi:SIN3-HDAC complex-associated factor [Discoglossus pictus]
MFGFYKPKTYRSPRGCCICKTKSSSSRFTDSKRYEGDFSDCFGLSEIRSGEICNACVLLVKRWKKLPCGSKKNWNHVVDAREGHNLKALKKHPKKAKSIASLRQRSDVIKNLKKKIANHYADSHSTASSTSPAHSSSCSNPSDTDTDTEVRPAPRRRSLSLFSCLDPVYWTRQKVCCGIVYEGLNGEIIIDAKLFNPCCRKKPETQDPEAAVSPTVPPTL